MRVIFLTHNYPRHPGDLPGGFLHPLARALRAAGADVRVVAPSDAGQGGEDRVDDIPVRRVRYAPAAWENLAYTGRMEAALRDPRALAAMGGMVRALRKGARVEAEGGSGPVVVHAHWWFPSGLAAPPELPLVVTLHGTDGRLLDRSPWARRLGTRVLRRADLVSTVSAALARQVERTTGVRVAPDAVQGLPLEATGLATSVGGGGVVTVARLTAQKRIHLLIEAAADLRQRGREVPVTIVGAGPEIARLQEQVAKLELEALVRFTGRLAAPEVAAILATADLFVLPAQAEGYGLAAAEALIAGVPVVVCQDGGGLVEVAGASPGARVAQPTAAGLADAMTSLLDDPEARSGARAAGSALRAQLAPAAVATRAIGWYRRAVEAHR